MYDQLRSILPLTTSATDGVLTIGGVAATELAAAYETPVIVYDGAHIDAAARAWIDAFAAYEPGVLVAYATKAFAAIGVLERLAALGLGADVSSLGELTAALRAGVAPERIVLHGNNKSRTELEAAISAGVGVVVVDSASELDLLAEIAAEHARVQPMLVRVNPDIVVETHRYINTSHAGSKFGVAASVAGELLARAALHEALEPRGVHVHLGSQLLDVDPWSRVLTWLAGWARTLQDQTGFTITTLDIGGGLGIAYTADQQPPTPADIAEVVIETLTREWTAAGLTLPSLIVEPGRSIVGSAAVTLYRIGVVKETANDDVRYVNVDGGMSDNPRPALYQARYAALLAERVHDAAERPWWIAGVHCESGDVLVEDAPLPEPRTGELLAIPATGAYAASMASTYNLVPRCAVVVADAGTHRPWLRRETLDELLARDVHAGANT